MAKGFNLTAEINLRGPSNVRQVVDKIRKQLTGLNANVDLKFDNKIAAQVSSANKTFQTFNQTLRQTQSVAKATASSFGQLKQATQTLNSSAKNVSASMKTISSASQSSTANIKKTADATKVMTTEFQEFGKQSALAVRRFAAFATVTGVIYKASNAITSATQDFIEFEKELVKVAQVSNLSISGLQGLVNNITRLSTSFGVASKDLIEVSRTLTQAGLSARDTSRALEALSKSALAPTFDDLNRTVEGSVALMRQFGISAGQLESALGSINAVAGKFAVEAGDIITAISRTGGVFASASKGVSEGTAALNEFIAVFTSVRATTRESAETIATGLRTIFTRIQRGDTIDALKEYGVQLQDLEGKFVGPYEATRRLAEGLSRLDPRDIRFSRIVEELGGFRQIGKVIPLIQQFTTAQQALAVAQQGQGSLARDAATAQLSLANQITKVREEFTALIRSIAQSSGFRDFVTLALDLTSGLLRLADAAKGALPALTAIFAIKGIKALGQFGTGFLGGLKRGDGQTLNSGGYVHHLARGGVVPGSGNRDTVPAMLTPGEFVIRKKAVEKIGAQNLEKLNRGGRVKKFGKGGGVANVQFVKEIDGDSLGINFTPAQEPYYTSSRLVGGDTYEKNEKKGTKAKFLADKATEITTKWAKNRGDKLIDNFKNANKYDKYGRPMFEAPDLLSELKAGTIYRKKQTSLLTGKHENYNRGGKVSRKVDFERGVGPSPFDKPSVSKLGPSIYNLQKNSGLSQYEFDDALRFAKTNDFSEDEFKRYLAKRLSYKKAKSNLLTDPESLRQIMLSGTRPQQPTPEQIALANLLKSDKPDPQYDPKYKYTQRFNDGGVVKRSVGYIDYDVIANPANEAVVAKGMEQTGVKGIRLYADHLTDLATRARKDSSISKLRAIYGVAGSGKTTLARGQGTDKGKLRETERFPVLTPEDIQKSTEVIVLSSSVSNKKLDEVFSQADRTYTLSSTTEADKSRVASQRASRDTTGVGLEGRKPGTTTNVESDTAIGEALLSDRLGDKSVVLGRTEDGRVRRKSKDELVEIIKKKIGFTWGGFSPMTAGHESIMDAAAAAGIPAQDFIYLVGSNEGITNSNPSSYRTAIFDQDARVLLAKAGAGSRGATVLPKGKGFEVPQAFDVGEQGGRRQVVVPGKGSTVFAADKDEKSLSKYRDAGYEVSNIERTGGISGTQVRDLIMSGNMGQLQQVLSPNVYELVSNNIKQIRNRANVLPEIIAEVKKRETVSLSEIESQIKSLGISRIDNKKVASDPEYAAKVDVLKELRKKRDKIKSFASFEPYSILAKMAAAEPEQYGLDLSMPGSSAKPMRQMGKKTQKANLGGFIQKFIDGGWVERMKKQSPEDAESALKMLNASLEMFAIGQRKVPNQTFDPAQPWEDIGAREVKQRIVAVKEYLQGKKIEDKKKFANRRGSGLKSTEQYNEQEMLDAITLYQGGSGPFTRAMVSGKKKFKDRDETYETSDVRDRLLSASQFTIPKQVYSGLGRSQLKEILKDAGITAKKLSSKTSESLKALVGKKIDFPTFLSTTVSKSAAESFVQNPGALLDIDAGSASQKVIDVIKAKNKTNVSAKASKSSRRLSGLEKISDQTLDRYDEEKEFILPPNIPFQITRAMGNVDEFFPQALKNKPTEEDKFIEFFMDENDEDFEKTRLDLKAKMLNRGGKVQKFATGGLVPGTGNRDTVPAMLTPGEFVIRKKAVETIGVGNLQKMNLGGEVKAGMVISEVLDNKQGSVDVSARNVAEATPQIGPLTSGSISSRYEKKEGQIRIGSSNFVTPEVLENIIADVALGASSTTKSYSTEVAGVGVKQNKVFDQAINKYTKKGIEKAAKAWGRSANVAVTNLTFAEDFSVPGGQIGSLFEQMIQGLAGGPIASAAEEDKRPFDFIGGLQELIKRGDRGLFAIDPSINYIDAKKSIGGTKTKDFRKKISDQIAIEEFNPIVAAIQEVIANQQSLRPNPQDSRGKTGPDRTVPTNLQTGVYGTRELVQQLKDSGINVKGSQLFNLGFRQGGDRKWKYLQQKTDENQRNFASGGSVQDTVPALLTPGEFVINKKAASRIGSQRLHKLNKADRIQGFNKGGAVGGVQRFANGGDVFEFSGNFNALDNQLESILTDAVLGAAKAAKAKSGASGGTPITSAEALRQARGKFDPTASFGLKQAAETGDKQAAEVVYAAQRKQVVAITKQIRASNKDITISQAKQAAEQRVGQAWGGLVTKVKKGSQVQEQVNQSGQQLAQSNKQNAQTQTAGAKKADRGINLGNLGTTLAFTGPMLAQQLGDTIGGTTGAGISGAATGFSTAVGIGSQFGLPGALVGAIAGTVMAVDGYNSAVARKESELAAIELDKTVESSVKTRESFIKTGSDADAGKLVANFQKIQRLEEKRTQANIQAEQPGMLATAAGYATFGLLGIGRDDRSEQEIAGTRTAEQQAGGENAQALIASMIEAGKTYEQTTEMLRSQGSTISDLSTAMAEADPEFRQQVVEIQKSNKAEDLKTLQINKLRDQFAANKQKQIEAQYAEAERLKASKALNRVILATAASMNRTFDNLEQSISAASNSLKNASDQVNNIISGKTGFTANLDALNVLQNPNAFSKGEQNQALRQGSQFAGQDRAFVEQMGRFSLDVNEIIGSVSATSLKAGDKPEVTAGKVVDAVAAKLESQFGKTDLTKQIVDDLREQISKGGDVDIQKLLENRIPEYNIGKRSIEASVKALKFLQDSLNFAANASNEYGKLQSQIRDNQASYQNTIIQSDLQLKEALGKKITVEERISGRTRKEATRSGVNPAQFNAQALSSRRDTLQKQVDNLKQSLQTSANAFDSTVPGAARQFSALTKKLAETENALKATEAGLESLPKVIEGNISDIRGEIGRIRQEIEGRQQSAASLGEKLVGSTPQELADLSNTYNLLNSTLNGQITTIQQSQAAQQAYYQTLQKGGTQQEAVAAAQQAFANQTKGAVSLFNELVQMSGLQGPEIMKMRADLYENFAKAQGVGLDQNPAFRKILELMRTDTGESPEIKALTTALEQQQQQLGQTFTKLNEGILAKQKDVLTTANQAFIKELNNVRLKFDDAQLNQFSLGIARPGNATGARRLEKGGVVYASQGKYVDFQPKGTDTVPAMLTPGEFVVNAKATKNNLGLLRSINSSAGSGKTFSKGGVVYAAGGGFIGGFMDILAQMYRNLDPRLLLEEDRSALENFGTVSGLGLIGAGAAAARSSGFREFLRNAMSSLGRLFSGMGNFSIGNLFSADLTSGGQSFRNIFSMGNQGSSLGRMPRASILGSRSLLSRGLGTVGLAANAYGGFTADTNQTNRNRYLNTVLAIGSGSGTTMGDVGAQSFLGSQLGVEQGGYADRQLGNWSQFGLQTAALTSMGVDPATAGLITAGSMVTQEGVGLYGDRQELADTRDRTRRMQDAGRPSTDQIVDDRARMIIQRAGGLNTYEGRSSAEVSFIIEQAKLLKEIRDLESKYDPWGPAGDFRNAELGQRLAALREEKERKFNEQKAKSLTRNENENFVRTGTLWNTSTFDEASINRDIQREAGFQSRRATAEADIVREERQKKQEEARRIAREQNQAEADENEYQRQLIEEEKQKRAEQKAIKVRRQKAVTMGLAANATDDDITQRQEVIDADWKNYKKYQQQDIAAQQAINKPLLPPNHEIYDDKYKDAIEQRQFLNSSIAEARGAIFDPNALPPFIRDNPAVLADYQRKWRLEQEDRIRQLYADLDAANKTIVEKEQSTKNPNIDADQEWEQYKSGQEKEADRRAKRVQNEQIRAKAEQMATVARFAQVNVPDKFSNPSQFFTWRKNMARQLQRNFPFGQRTPEAMKALGIDPAAVDAIYEPFSADEAASVYSAMINSGKLSGSQRNLAAALRAKSANLDKDVEQNPAIKQIIASASDADKKFIYQQFQRTFGKQVGQVNRFNKLVANLGNLTGARAGIARANIIRNAARQGVIDPNASDEENIDRLNAMRGNKLAQFLYPNKQTRNKAIRISSKPKSTGGVVYASTGMLVPYEPRGTDTVPAMLTPGEFVVNRAATQKHRPLLESINRSKGGPVKYLADGGSTDVTKIVAGQPIERENETAKNVKENLSLSKVIDKTSTDSYSFSKGFRRDSFKDSQDKYNKSTQLNTQGFDEINSNADQAFGSVFDKLNFLVANAASERFEPANVQQALAFGNIQAALDEFSGDILGFSRGGSVPLYAQKGMMVNYQPKGTDTVPAMLTPGEFVVNAKASKENLGLLQAINSGYMSDGGVVYAQNGGIQQQKAAAAQFSQMVERNKAIKEAKERQAETNKDIREMMKRIAITPAASAGLGRKFVEQEMRGQIGANIEQLKGQAVALSGSDIAGWTQADGFMALSESVRNGNRKYKSAKALINQMRQMQGNLNSFFIGPASNDPATLILAGLWASKKNEYIQELEDMIIALKQSWVATDPQLQGMYGDIQGLSKGGIVYAAYGTEVPRGSNVRVRNRKKPIEKTPTQAALVAGVQEYGGGLLDALGTVPGIIGAAVTAPGAASEQLSNVVTGGNSRFMSDMFRYNLSTGTAVGSRIASGIYSEDTMSMPGSYIAGGSQEDIVSQMQPASRVASTALDFVSPDITDIPRGVGALAGLGSTLATTRKVGDLVGPPITDSIAALKMRRAKASMVMKDTNKTVSETQQMNMDKLGSGIEDLVDPGVPIVGVEIDSLKRFINTKTKGIRDIDPQNQRDIAGLIKEFYTVPTNVEDLQRKIDLGIIINDRNLDIEKEFGGSSPEEVARLYRETIGGFKGQIGDRTTGWMNGVASGRRGTQHQHQIPPGVDLDRLSSAIDEYDITNPEILSLLKQKSLHDKVTRILGTDVPTPKIDNPIPPRRIGNNPRPKRTSVPRTKDSSRSVGATATASPSGSVARPATEIAAGDRLQQLLAEGKNKLGGQKPGLTRNQKIGAGVAGGTGLAALLWWLLQPREEINMGSSTRNRRVPKIDFGRGARGDTRYDRNTNSLRGLDTRDLGPSQEILNMPQAIDPPKSLGPAETPAVPRKPRPNYSFGRAKSVLGETPTPPPKPTSNQLPAPETPPSEERRNQLFRRFSKGGIVYAQEGKLMKDPMSPLMQEAQDISNWDDILNDIILDKMLVPGKMDIDKIKALKKERNINDLRKKQFNYSDDERAIDNFHEWLQEMIGGNRLNNRLIAYERHVRGSLPNQIQKFYTDNIAPKDDTKGIRAYSDAKDKIKNTRGPVLDLQELRELKKTDLYKQPYKKYNKGGIVYAQDGKSVPENSSNIKEVSQEQTSHKVGTLIAQILPFVSSPAGAAKLAEMGSKNLGITQVTVRDEEHFAGTTAGAQVMGGAGSIVKFRDDAGFANNNLVLHEFMHALQNTTHNSGANNENIASLQNKITSSLGKDIQEYAAKGFPGLTYKAGYSDDKLIQYPNELMANMGVNPQGLSSEGKSLFKKMMKFYGFSKGGIVYANQGMLVPYQPKGTDTVPAMLTPGEFVVNRAATQQNLPLLKAINNGSKAYSSGGVVYAEDGIYLDPISETYRSTTSGSNRKYLDYLDPNEFPFIDGFLHWGADTSRFHRQLNNMGIAHKTGKGSSSKFWDRRGREISRAEYMNLGQESFAHPATDMVGAAVLAGGARTAAPIAISAAVGYGFRTAAAGAPHPAAKAILMAASFITQAAAAGAVGSGQDMLIDYYAPGTVEKLDDLAARYPVANAFGREATAALTGSIFSGGIPSVYGSGTDRFKSAFSSTATAGMIEGGQNWVAGRGFVVDPGNLLVYSLSGAAAPGAPSSLLARHSRLNQQSKLDVTMANELLSDFGSKLSFAYKHMSKERAQRILDTINPDSFELPTFDLKNIDPIDYRSLYERQVKNMVDYAAAAFVAEDIPFPVSMKRISSSVSSQSLGDVAAEYREFFDDILFSPEAGNMTPRVGMHEIGHGLIARLDPDTPILKKIIEENPELVKRYGDALNKTTRTYDSTTFAEGQYYLASEAGMMAKEINDPRLLMAIIASSMDNLIQKSTLEAPGQRFAQRFQGFESYLPRQRGSEYTPEMTAEAYKSFIANNPSITRWSEGLSTKLAYLWDYQGMRGVSDYESIPSFIQENQPGGSLQGATLVGVAPNSNFDPSRRRPLNIIIEKTVREAPWSNESELEQALFLEISKWKRQAGVLNADPDYRRLGVGNQYGGRSMAPQFKEFLGGDTPDVLTGESHGREELLTTLLENPKNRQIPEGRILFNKIIEALGVEDLQYKASGGMVYANQGMLVPYQPKGTDTVPAMLTPGEFVVNREATKHNLGLLRAINRSGGGRVSYLANGTDPGMGFDFIKPFRELSSVLPNIVSGFRDLLSNLQTPNGVAGGVNNNIGDLSGLSEFTSAFRSFTGELSALASQFPSQINLQLAPASVNVNITGGEVFNTLQPALSEMITMQVNTQLNAWVAGNFDGSVDNIA